MRPLELVQRQLEGVLRRIDRAHRDGEIAAEQRERLRPHVLEAIEAAREDRPIHAKADSPPARQRTRPPACPADWRAS